MMQKVIIASQNPVKINSTKIGFSKIFEKEQFHFEGVSVPSGVADQPMTEAETLQGAVNRSVAAKEMIPDAYFWVGIEGGIQKDQFGIYAFAWVVVKSPDKQGQSRTSTFYLPDRVVNLLQEGVELGEANDIVFRETNSKQQGGAVGSLTNRQLGRTEYYVQAVMLALVPFCNPKLY
jgi:inosine/xanthosine triphosphatase